MKQDIIIICGSMYHGNTMKIADEMARTLNCPIINYAQAQACDLSRYKVVGLGSGIFFKSHHPKLIDIASRLSSMQKVFLFSTHGSPFLGKYHSKIKEKLAINNVPIIGEFSCPGYDGTGPFLIFGGGNIGKPNERAQRRASRFIKSILPEYAVNTDRVIGGRFVEVRKEQCIRCGSCAKVCPVNVFELNDKQSEPIRAIDCIHCRLCTDVCPTAAIAVQHSWPEAIAIAKRHASKNALYE